MRIKPYAGKIGAARLAVRDCGRQYIWGRVRRMHRSQEQR